MPIDYKKYHPRWKTVIRPAILARAGFCCENCGVEDRSVICRDSRKLLYYPGQVENSFLKNCGFDFVLVVLTIAHLDHNVSNNDYSNLKALCQRCHNRYDAKNRASSRKFVQANSSTS